MAYTKYKVYAMEPSEAISKLLPAFEQYYTVKKDNITPPFCNEAEFRSHNEQYFLVRSAHIADIDSNEFVYFATAEELTEEKLSELVTTAWTEGLKKVRPYNGHRNSDVTLIIISKSTTPEAENIIKKTKLYKSYKFSFHGWSHFKLAVVELNSQGIYFNKFGKDYLKLLKNNIFGGNSK